MRARPSAPRSILRATSALALVSATLCVAPPSRADVPLGWSLASSIDGGTSSIGASIATTDTVAVVGAPFATATSGATPTGAVFVFSNTGGGWTSQRVAAPSPIDNGNFGTSVAASGSLFAVGAAGTPAAAYVFDAVDGGYAIAQTWTDPKSDTNASFGGSVAVFAGATESYVAVTAPQQSAGKEGIVYVSRQVDGGAWGATPVAITDPSAESFGISVAFAGNGEMLVGDPDTNAGEVLVYAPLADGGWDRQGTLPFALDGGSVQGFGNGIATSGDLAVVTAPGSADDAGTYNGVAFVLAVNDAGVWTQQAVLAGAAAESFGNGAPSIHDGLVAVGSLVNATNTGQVDVWAESGGIWVRVPSSSLTGDSYYGQAVGSLGDALFVGDTSALGAGSVSDVTSSLFIETALESDAGVALDATVGGSDAGGEGGSAPAAPDGGGTSQSADAALEGDGGGTTAPSAAASSGGCSCRSVGGEGKSPLLALAAQGAFLAMVWIRRRNRARGA